ncbi:uncharacterized protein LOC115621044 [Scaptodrosophila lebanonensis]|uniref:Uncharacterized protein LOC115621044 n=1 Tax=Drosophila lebanonensis TaxID=7225 RepID=A0A6J2T0K7_DROLE|nr:uncharacterized protein LOC115621044 [Scaptodrosophila lebanonensis]
MGTQAVLSKNFVETTTMVAELMDGGSTTISPQPLASAPTTAMMPTVEVVLNKTAMVETTAEVVETDAVDEFVGTSFESLGVGLEEGIRNEVKNEVESDIEAASAPIVETLHDEIAQEVKPLENNEDASARNETTAEIQANPVLNAREPKTLEAEQKPEDKPKLEQSQVAAIAATDGLEPVQSVESEGNQKTDDEPVTDCIGEASEPESESRSRPLPSGETSDLVSVILDESRAITEQPITKTNLLALEPEIEILKSRPTTPTPVFEVTKHQVTKKQGVEDLLPIEVPELDIPTEMAKVAENEETVVREMHKLPRLTDEPEHLNNLNEIYENVFDGMEKDEESNVDSKSTLQILQNKQPLAVEDNVTIIEDASGEQEEGKKAVQVDHTVLLDKEEAIAFADPQLSSTDVTPVDPEDFLLSTEAHIVPKVKTEGSQSNDHVQESDSEIAVVSEPTSASTTTATISTTEGTQETAYSPEDIEQVKEDTLEDVTTELPEVEAPNDSQLKIDDPKARSEDSTATPLVSYPPHDAEQTFNDNLADERTAHLSLAANNRSTLIIAVCSGIAVLFIVISLVIFVVSFQRQHGTLDIEMQEQRLGKDNLDEEDAQMKLLDVELPTPVVSVSMGTEETEECL